MSELKSKRCVPSWADVSDGDWGIRRRIKCSIHGSVGQVNFTSLNEITSKTKEMWQQHVRAFRPEAEVANPNRDDLICRLWVALRNASDQGKLSDEDIELWTSVTAHSAVQGCLDHPPRA